jgi:purine-binding chemotaxis protein CheW
VVNLSQLIGVPSAETNRNILIMKQNEEKKGLLIEEVVEVVDIEADDIQLTDEDGYEYYSGIVSFPDKVANVIQVNHMIFE